MFKPLLAAPLLAASVLLAGPALAQQPAPTSPSLASPGPAIPGIVATTNNPNLAVSAVRLEKGQRISQIIGASVFSDAGERIGGVDDLVMIESDKLSVAIIGVGGFLGLGTKLVAVPYRQLKLDGDRLVLPGMTKAALEAMPSFSY